MPPAVALARVQVTRATPLALGLAVACLAAFGAWLLGAVTPLPPVFFALAIGMVIGSMSPADRLCPGITFASREVLRFGVALLGLAITFGEIAALGWQTALVTIVALVITLILGARICRFLGDTREGAIVSAAAVAICGASAAMAVAAAFPKGTVKDDELARSVAGITVAGTLAMLAFPLIGYYLNLSPAALGTLLGGSIHEVAQAAASGFSVSDEVGKAATVVKMLRVACMGGVVACVGLLVCRKGSAGQPQPVFPGFLITFVLLAGVASTGLVPPAIKGTALELSRWCLLIAIAALGMRTSPQDLLSGGGRPVLAILANSMLLALLMLSGILILGD